MYIFWYVTCIVYSVLRIISNVKKTEKNIIFSPPDPLARVRVRIRNKIMRIRKTGTYIYIYYFIWYVGTYMIYNIWNEYILGPTKGLATAQYLIEQRVAEEEMKRKQNMANKIGFWRLGNVDCRV